MYLHLLIVFVVHTDFPDTPPLAHVYDRTGGRPFLEKKISRRRAQFMIIAYPKVTRSTTHFWVSFVVDWSLALTARLH